MGYQTIEVRKLTPVIGAEIFGVDLARPLGNQVFQEIHDALMDNLVIFFRDQELTHEQHKAFGRRFGELHLHPTSTRTGTEHPEILVIKADEHSKHVAGEEWHSDVSCDPEPPMGSILYMKQLPPDGGGNTLFANMYRAYETLSAPIQRLCEGLTAVHDGAQVYGGRFGHKPKEGGFPAERASRGAHASGDRPQGALRQSQLHHAHRGPAQERERRAAGDALPPQRDAGIPVPLRLAAQLDRLLGQSRRHASCDVGLLPAQAAGLPRDRQGRQAVLSRIGNDMALITYLTRIQFDFGALKLLEAELQLLGMRRPLIVTDKGVIAAGLWARVKEQLPGNMPIALYDGTPENPTEAAMRDALRIYKEEGCDGIIAIGGGSPMDLAKAVGLMATHPGTSLQPYSFVEGGAGKITAAVAPIVAIPTTSGTGSEVSRGGVIIMDSGRKLAIGSPHLIPRLALIDPELTLGLPPHLTAGTGMDAFTHNIECFLSNAMNPPADLIALDGLEKAWTYVERATRDGSDREARYNMAMAAMEGAMVFQKGLGAVHALSHPTGGLKGYRLHHGTLNAVYLPAVLRFNEPAVGEKYRKVAQVMGLPASEANAAGVANAVAELNARLGFPKAWARWGWRRTPSRRSPTGRSAITATSRHRASRPRPSTCS